MKVEEDEDEDKDYVIMTKDEASSAESAGEEEEEEAECSKQLLDTDTSVRIIVCFGWPIEYLFLAVYLKISFKFLLT